MKFTFLKAGSLLAALAFGVSPCLAQQSGNPDDRTLKTRRKPVPLSPELLAKVKQQFAVYSEAKKLLKEQRWAEAEGKLIEAITSKSKIFSTPASYYGDLAEAQYRQGKLQEALQSMKLAFLGEPRAYSDTLHAVRFAEIAEQCGEPEIVPPVWARAYRFAQDSFNEVKEAAKQASTKNQKDALVLATAGRAARYRSDIARTTELYQRALQLDPECALAHFNLGRLGGKTPEALGHFQAASKYGSPALKLDADVEIRILRHYLEQE